ncbi:helix-turn-helix transcriptional regulator [Luteimonas sp. RD2P54]|uniref:Helix-turn-helix transcriptional regulator n=1 Tax=Luteimonas endophytica TaxID=3042023 RepID=A0ABT6J796_9GAMM|nr:helix-turn-helix transcriptional regulator [Luteimonas endophytica]MDH5822705.1 helix-turn-helix transcriptional regulator [Luteimonas endophytica]
MSAKSIYKPEYKVLRRLLFEMRESAGLKQKEMASRLQRPQSYVSSVERGRRRMDLLQLREYCLACEQEVVDFVRRFEDEITAGCGQPPH